MRLLRGRHHAPLVWYVGVYLLAYLQLDFPPQYDSPLTHKSAPLGL